VSTIENATLENGAMSERQSALLEQIRSLYGPVQAELAEVDQILRNELSSDYPFVNDLCQHGFRLGGKRLRPAVLLLIAQACGGVRREHLLLAAVVEMVHTATLVHDDVLDEADIRRHEQTVNARWNNEASVLLGDYLFTHSFYLASTLKTTFGCRTIGKATNIVCEGELRQIASRGNYELTEAEYLGIIEAKTAELVACAASLGAHYAGADEATHAQLEAYGRELGIAFQICDDLLDLLGDEDETGKSLGTDLEKEKPTLPIIHYLRESSPIERAELNDLLDLPPLTRCRELLARLEAKGSLEYARLRAAEYTNRALERLEILPESEAKQILLSLPRFVVERRN